MEENILISMLADSVLKWNKLVAEIEKEENQLIQGEDKLFKILRDFWKRNNFEPDKCKQLLNEIASYKNKHPSSEFKENLQEFRGLCNNYYTKDKAAFEAFQKALGGKKTPAPKSKPIPKSTPDTKPQFNPKPIDTQPEQTPQSDPQIDISQNKISVIGWIAIAIVCFSAPFFVAMKMMSDAPSFFHIFWLLIALPSGIFYGLYKWSKYSVLGQRFITVLACVFILIFILQANGIFSKTQRVETAEEALPSPIEAPFPDLENDDYNLDLDNSWITGNWHWESEDSPASISFTIQLSNGNITGSHSIASANYHTDDGENSISGTMKDGIANVKFTSGYSGTIGYAEIKKINDNEIKWITTQFPERENYFPKEVILKRNNEITSSVNPDTEEFEGGFEDYLVLKKTFFYNEADYNTQRKAYLIEGEIVNVQNIYENFGYVAFVNSKGIKTEGWIKMSDLSKIGDESLSTNSEHQPIEQESSETNSNKIYDHAEEMPQFSGGDRELMNFLANNIKYPVIAQEQGIQGTVVLRFVVGKDGSITDIQVIRSLDSSCDKEAIRVVKAMPKWIAGKQNGQNVAVSFTLPISFRLD